MRAFALSALLLFLSLAAAADDVLGPADYMKIMADSKLRYSILTEPSKTPVAVMDCPRRDVDTRVVVKGKEKSLVAWTLTPAAEKLLAEGEVLFRAEKMSEAGEKYAAAIEADPQAATAYFSYADTLLFGANDAERALELYRKGIALDPTLPNGHFFASTALVHLGRPDEAREQIIKALVYHPAYESVWKIAAAQPERWKAKPIVRFKFEPPAGYLGGDPKKGIDVFGGKDFQWGGYAICKAAWANEKRFAKRHTREGWGVDEEVACVLNQLMSQYNATEAKLEEQQKKDGVATPNIQDSDIVNALPSLERHLYEVAQAHLLDGYVLFEIIDQHCPLSMSLMSDEALRDEEAYIRKYVIVAAE